VAAAQIVRRHKGARLVFVTVAGDPLVIERARSQPSGVTS